MISRNLARKIANDEDVDVKFSHNRPDACTVIRGYDHFWLS